MKVLVPMLVAIIAACGGGKDSDKPSAQTVNGVNRDTLTERQRDSILAQSRIPGARGVGKAMRVADSTSAPVFRPSVRSPAPLLASVRGPLGHRAW
ncbi:MAG: hypothetical protein AUI08_10695 [Gemmatimonadetes bacterium 13_2_20CM_2_65_7]|nr:MAG: hypothetical protein AUI08_10695 [Gemmatimonadetes bacterium 13_2_20CM_2_65_7]